MTHTSNISIILLAAGASTRLGTPKQLLNIKGEILLQKIYQTCIQSKSDSVVVVTGSGNNQVQKSIQKFDPIIAHNPSWENGMASSIQIGLKRVLLKKPDTEAVLIVLCDQYFVDTILLNSIIQHYLQTKKTAVCCNYENTIGVPALYPKALFPHLLDIEDKKGAKKLLLMLQKENKVVILPFPQGKYDIDTIEQLEALKNKIK